MGSSLIRVIGAAQANWRRKAAADAPPWPPPTMTMCSAAPLTLLDLPSGDCSSTHSIAGGDLASGISSMRIARPVIRAHMARELGLGEQHRLGLHRDEERRLVGIVRRILVQ